MTAKERQDAWRAFIEAVADAWKKPRVVKLLNDAADTLTRPSAETRPGGRKF